MNSRCILLLMFAGTVYSCQWGVPHNRTKPAITKDTLVYTYTTIKQRAPDCGNKPDSSCTVAKITYPVFTNQKPLNDTITGRLLDAYRVNKKPDDNLLQQATNFIKSYMDDISRKTGHPGASYTLESSATVVRQDSSLATIQIDRYVYDGGAHGSDYTGFINWNTKGNKKITLNDVLIAEYKAGLTKVAEKIFRTQEKLSDTGSLKNYFFKDAKFSLNNNFLITPIGITFLYNDYEIKPYSAGQTTILIPYVQIEPLLRSNTVISQYIKK